MHGASDSYQLALPVPASRGQHIHQTAIFRTGLPSTSPPPTAFRDNKHPDVTWNLRLFAASLLALRQSLILSDGHGCYCFLLVLSTTKSTGWSGSTIGYEPHSCPQNLSGIIIGIVSGSKMIPLSKTGKPTAVRTSSYVRGNAFRARFSLPPLSQCPMPPCLSV